MFYGPDQAAIHDARFGDVARDAARLVLDRLAASDLRRGTVVDLGCGSGIFARALVDAGYEVIGIDISPAMIDLARQRVPEGEFTVASVHEWDVPSTPVAVVALGEVLNYATDERAGLAALEFLAARVRAVLAPGGVFVFDVATPGRGGPTGSRDRFHDADDWSLAMRSTEHDGTLERAITIFVRDGDQYRRVDEHHVLRLYEPESVTRVLKAIGFTVEVSEGYGPTPADFPGWAVFVAS